MQTKEIVKELIKYYAQEGAWDKLEALYIIAIFWIGDEYYAIHNAKENIKIKYDTDEAVEEVEKDIKKLCEESGIRFGRDEEIIKECKRFFPNSLKEKVIKACNSLSVITKRFLFLMYKEGTLLKHGEIMYHNEEVLSHFYTPYKIIFGELINRNECEKLFGKYWNEDMEYKMKNSILEDVKKELIKAGLIYNYYWSNSRKHTFYVFVVPPFAKEVWEKLDEILLFPRINVEEGW